MFDTTYVDQLGRTISGEFYFGTMCRETRRRIAISTDTSPSRQSQYKDGNKSSRGSRPQSVRTPCLASRPERRSWPVPPRCQSGP
jgi:hypothetical protein